MEEGWIGEGWRSEGWRSEGWRGDGEGWRVKGGEVRLIVRMRVRLWWEERGLVERVWSSVEW